MLWSAHPPYFILQGKLPTFSHHQLEATVRSESKARSGIQVLKGFSPESQLERAKNQNQTVDESQRSPVASAIGPPEILHADWSLEIMEDRSMDWSA